MVAVFTGNGLGLFNSSLTQLGGALGGSAGLGQGADRQYVNLATGNLLLQGQDEFLTFRGLGVGMTRTYNSLGTANDVGADGWVTGFERNVTLLSGTFNTSGSVMRRYTGDGGYQDFTWVSANAYQSTTGDGAHDTLTWSASTSTWTYVEGSTRYEEQYADHADATLQGRLTRIVNPSSDGTTPVAWNVVYNGSNQITEIRADDGTTSGDALLFTYDGSGRVTGVSTRENGATKTQVFYTYDTQGRLSSVTTDLTPTNAADNTWSSTASANDGHLFRTTYAYDGNTLRVTSVQQSDGTKASYTYDGNGRVKTVTRGDTNADDTDGAGETVTYAYGTNSTTVTDSVGRAWTYAFDANDQLTQVTGPAVSGQSGVTTYAYDASGNVTQIKTVSGSTVLSRQDYKYDANGNVTDEWDALGNAVNRTYSATNQLLTETRYAVSDADGPGTASAPGGGQTTHYIYDAQDRVRFVVDAAGDVTEFTYATSGNGIGQQSAVRTYLGAAYGGNWTLSDLTAWATGAQKASSTLSEFGYDAWGRLSQRTDYATVDANGAGVLDTATGITRYTYDAQGLLRQQISVLGSGRTLAGSAPSGSAVTDYAYDGLGRLLGVTSSASGSTITDANSTQTTYAYTDSGSKIVTTTDAGVVRTEARNAAGRVLSVSEVGNAGGGTQTRTTTNVYDSAGELRISQDASGGRSYYFYDARGRLEATVDATGAVVQSVYDGDDRVVQARAYSNRVTTTAWTSLGGVPANFAGIGVVADDAADRVTGTTYDAAGRVASVTDGLASSTDRTITTYSYNGLGQLLGASTTDAAGTASTARVERYFYDATGHQIATLDAAGYLTESRYDRAGRLVSQTSYATATATAQRASGTLDQLRPATNAAADQSTYFYYNGRNQLVGTVDAQGYLTENVIDDAGNTRAERRYATAVTVNAASDTLSSVRSRAGSYRESRMAYNGLGQLTTQTNPEGTVTAYTYDEAGRLVKTDTAQGTTEVRENNERYNAFGELIGELDGEGSTHLQAGMTDAQLDAVYAQYGVRHGYNVLGQRIESTDAAGNKTWYFYDGDGRMTFTVKGQADAAGVANAEGEVTENRYDAFGDVATAITYTGRISIPTPGDRNSLQGAIGTLSYDADTDAVQTFAYDTRGLLTGTVGIRGWQTSYVRDAFGQVTEQDAQISDDTTIRSTYAYDARGLTLARTDGADGSTRTQGWNYDAFGRVIGQTDAKGQTITYGYDRLGQLISTSQTVQGQAQATHSTYDAYGRVLTTVDADGHTTSYAYSDANRTATVTTPEGVVMTTQLNRHGETWKVTDGDGATVEYSYNLDGQLVQTKDAEGGIQTQSYDTRGLLTRTQDATGHVVEYTYDAVGRVLTRVEDPDGLALATRYAYDGQGRTVSVTDPKGVVTTTTYSCQNRAGTVTQDANGLALVTEYSWDALGQELDVTQAKGSDAERKLHYTYDSFGRRTSETVDPDGLNLTTRYTYDANDNVVARTDAAGNVTRYAYDEANQRVFVVDAAGDVTRNWYDADGQVIATRAYSQPISLTSLPVSASLSAIQGLVVANDGSDHQGYTIYDADGNIRYAMQADSATTLAVQEYRYDADGHVVETIAYGVDIPASTAKTVAAVASALGSAGGTADDKQRVTRNVHDADGRLRFVVDDTGSVTEQRYDAQGRVVETRSYAQALPSGTAMTETAVAAALASQTGDNVRSTRTAYDNVGRVVQVTDAAGKTESYAYDAQGNRIGYTDKLGQQWTYAYDAAGRMVAETSPSVQVASVDAAGNVTTATRAIVTRIGYDALGNVISRTEDADSSQARTTLYAYDSAGHQIRTTFPDAYAINASTGTLVATNSTPTIDVTYDALGQAVVQKDANDNYSYKVYDTAGRLAYDIDQEGYATSYGYDAFGNQTRLTRYATRLNTAALPGWSAGQALTQAQVASALVPNAAADRTLTTAYDALGRKTSVTQSALAYYKDDGTSANGSPVTRYAYDRFGQLFEESVLLQGTAGQSDAVWANTWHYYDAVGREVFTVDADGYATGNVYDAMGELVRQTEYARALAANAVGTSTPPAAPQAGDADTGYDRVSSWTYDALGRKTSETVSRHYQLSNGTPETENAVTQLEYDAAGQVISTTTDAGKTFTRYDALGHVISVQEPTRKVLTASADNSLQVSTQVDLTPGTSLYEDASPYTTMSYDAFGNVVQTRRYANGLKPGQSAPVADNARDQIETVLYDHQGRAVMTKDSTGSKRYTAYDNTDHVLGTWYTLSGSDASRNATIRDTYTYDKVGQQLSTVQVRATTVGTTTETSEAVTYNAFGEITLKTYAGLSGTLNYGYDAAGHLVSSNEGGATKSFGYNLAGYQVRESHMAYLQDGQDVAAVTQTQTDKLGRVLAVSSPSAAGGSSTVQQTLDRWGNVIEVIDPRGYQTDYRYNEFNQVVREEQPWVEVMDEHGQASLARPVNQWFYDAMGNLVGTEDANGNIRANEFDASGQLTKSIDALGNVTLYAYDAMGNQRMVQNALGYLTFKEYDREGRIVATGDYLANGTGRTKTALQQYVLDENGDRLSVTDVQKFKSLYDYDGNGQMIRSQTATGVAMNYAYDVQAKKTLEQYPRVTDMSYTPPFAGGGPLTPNEQIPWQDDGNRVDHDGETARVDQNTWAYDAYGRLIDHDNLSAQDSDYGYDSASGQLVSESDYGTTYRYDPETTSVVATDNPVGKTYTYYANGLVKSVTQSDGTQYLYEYDAAGNKTREESSTTDGDGHLVHTVTQTTYDSHGRIKEVIQDDLSDTTPKRIFDVTYDYDAVGNRRHVDAKSGYGVNVDAVPDTAITFTGDQGKAVSWTVPSGVFSNANGGGLTYALQVLEPAYTTTDPDALATTQVASMSLDGTDGMMQPDAPPGGTITVPAAWVAASTVGLSYSASTGKITGTLQALGSTYNYPLRIVALDGSVAITTLTMGITVNPNHAPTVATIPAQSVGRNTAWSFNAKAYFSDADGDALTFSASGLPSGLSINASTGVISGTAANATSSSTVTVTASDGRGGSVGKAFTLSVVNSAPVFSGATLPSFTGDEDKAVSWSVPSALFTDPNGDALTYTLQVLSGSTWTDASTVGLSYSASTNKITGTLQALGSTYGYSLRIVASDGSLQTASSTMSITVNPNHAPTASTIPAQSVGRNTAWSFNAKSYFSDADGDALTFTASGLPSGLSINGSTGVISGTAGNATSSSTVTVTASDGRGGSVSKTFTLSVIDNAPVYGGATLPNFTGDQGRAVSWTVPSGLFSDANGDALTYALQVLSGSTWTAASTVGLGYSASTNKITGTLQPLGSTYAYQLRIVASDGSLQTATPTMNITVNPNHAPTVTTVPTQNVGRNTAWSLSVPSHVSDADGDALSYTVTGLPSGFSFNSSTGVISGTAGNATSSSTVTISASDGRGGAVSTTFALNVVDNAPVYSGATLPSFTGDEARAVSWTVPGGLFTDPNGDTLTYTLQVLEPAYTTTDPDALATTQVASMSLDGTDGMMQPDAPPGGTITVPAAWVAASTVGLSYSASTGKITGTLKPLIYDGGTKYTYSLRIVASDGSMTTATPNMGITVNQEHAPTATTIPAQSVGRNTAWSFNAKSYFSDADGDALTFTASGLPSGFSINASTGVISGTASSTTSSATVTVSASDGRGGSVSKAFTLSVVDSAPVYGGATLPSFTGDEGKAVSWTVPTGLFTDPNGDALTYTLQVLEPAYTTTDPGALATTQAASLSLDGTDGMMQPDAPPGGTITVPAAWVAASTVGLSYNASTGKITGTVKPLVYDGGTKYTYSLRIVASDGTMTGDSSNIGVTVNQDHAPVATTIPAQSVGRNTAWSFNAKSYFSDADGDALTFSASGLPSGLSINSSTGVISGTAANATSSSTVTVTANDGRGHTGSKAFTLSVVNTAPTYAGASTLSGYAGDQGKAVSWTVPGGLFSDANGDALTYTLQVLSGSTWTAASAVGLSYSASTNKITGTLAPLGSSYSYSLRIVASDGSASTATPNIGVTVNQNHVPTASTIPAQSIGRNVSWSFNAKSYFSDADGDALTFSASGLPSGLSINASTGVISGKATGIGSSTVTVTASDGRGGSVGKAFTLGVVNNAPVYSGATLPGFSGNEGHAVAWTVPSGLFTDPNGDALTYTLQVYHPQYISYPPDAQGPLIESTQATDGTQDSAEPASVMVPMAPPGGGVIIPAGWEPASDVGLSYNASTGLITGTLEPYAYGDPGDDAAVLYSLSLRIVASDGSATAVTPNISATVNPNHAPTASTIPAQNIVGNTAWSFNAKAYFSDADGDALTFSATGLPGGLSLNGSTGVISGTATANGSYSVVVTANDGHGHATSTTFALSVTDGSPVYNGTLPARSGTVGQAVSWSLPAGAFTAANGHSLSYALQVYVPAHWEDAPLLDLAIDASSATDAATEADAPDATVSSDGMMQPDAPPGQIHVPAAWESASFVGLSINASTGLITGTLKPLYYGESTVSYTPQLRIIASDGSASATGQFDVTEAHTTGTSSVASLSSVSAQEAADTDAGDADAALRLDAAAPADLATESVSMQPMMLPPPGPGDDLPPGYSPPTHVTYRETDSWYTYDAENHILVNNGQMDASTHVIGVKNNDDTSYSSTYDAVGEEVTHTTKTGGTGYIQQTAYDLRGNKTVVYQAVVQGSATPAGIAMTYTYNAQNQLSHVLTYYAAGSTESITLTQGATPPLPTLQVAVHLDGWVQSDEAYTYDATTGVLVSQTKQTRDENGRTYSMSLGAYETTGALPVHADGFTNATTDYAVVYAAADAAGRQTAYTYQSPDYGNATITYGTHYIGLDSWQEATVTGGSSNPSYKTTTTTLSYDGYGKLVKQVESTYGVSGLDDRATYYGYDGDGQVLTRQAGTVKSNGTFVLGTDADGNLDKRMYVYAAGQEMAELHAGDYSRWNTDGGAGSIASLAGSGSYSAGGSRVVVQAGDTLTSLAQRVYGDASRWYVLADANGLSSASDVLVEGASLKAPSITVNGNDAGTFKPYDASEAIGNTAPSLPYVQPPSSKDHCQALSAIIQIAVTVIVTIISRNPVVGAAAGDAAGQFSSAALNGRFDWRGFVEGATNPLHVAENGLVAASGLSDWVIPAVMLFGNDKQKAVFNPIGYGMDYDYTRTAIAAGAAYAGSAAGGMVSSAAGYGAAATAGAAATGAAAAYGTSYGLSKLAGYDVAFSWKEVAASAATAAAGSGISQGLGVEYSQVPGTGAVVRAQPFSWNAVTADVLTSAADYGLRKGLGLDAHWDTERVLADAFGNALGNAIVGAQPSPLAVDREQIPQEPVALQVEDSLGPMTMGPLGAQPNLDDLDAQLQKANQDIANANARLAELDKEEAALGGNPTGSYRYDENGLEIDIIGGRPESEGGNVLDGIDSKIQGFNQIVRDELVDEGAQALHDGNQAAYVLGGLKYAFYQTFMPDSVEGAVVGLVGGKVIGSGLNLAAKGAVAAAPWLGRDVGSLASDGYQWAKNPLGEEFDAGYSPQNLFDAYQDVPRSSAIDFSQAPRLDVGGVPNNVGLRSSAVISSDRAESFLIKNGIEPDFAKSYIAEMDGDITARLVRPNEDFLRYFDAPKDQGSFLTKTVFDSPSSAVDGLNLGPYGNKADLVQTVTSKGRTIILEAGVKNGGADVRQFLIHDRSVFEFSPGRNY